VAESARIMNALLDSTEQVKVQTNQMLSSMGKEAFGNAVVGRYVFDDQVETDVYRCNLLQELESHGYFELIESWQSIGCTRGDDAQNRSRSSGSRTAVSTAIMRYVAHELGFGPDQLAVHFIDRSLVTPAYIEEQRAKFNASGYLPGVSRATIDEQREKPWHAFLCSVAYLQLRTCMMDDVLARFYEEFCDGAANVVILGAGFDTRFYRNAVPPNILAYEIDTEASQKMKLETMAQCGAPEFAQDGRRVTFVPCDFAVQSFVESLKSVKCDLSVPTLIVWEGVTYYLTRSEVTATLRSVASMLGPCAIAFDYFSPLMLEEYRERMLAAGEAFQFGIDAHDLVLLANELQLDVIDHLSGVETLPRYLPRRKDGESVGVACNHKVFILLGNENFASTYSRKSLI
jgi:methyltransferase (TIGR00027 family)